MTNKVMRNKMIVIAAVTLMAASLTVGCGSNAKESTSSQTETTASAEETKEEAAVAGTYRHVISAEDLAGTTAHNGFISAVSPVGVNTLTLNEDGTYSYRKQVSNFDETGAITEGGIDISYTFTGNYSTDGTNVTLNAPEDCEFYEEWGNLNPDYLLNSSGKASEKALVSAKEGEEFDPLCVFPGEYYNFAETYNIPVIVEVSGSEFTYAAVASSDDE